MNKLAFNLGFKSVLERSDRTKELVKLAIEVIRNSFVTEAFLSAFNNITKQAGIGDIAKRLGKKVATKPGQKVVSKLTGQAAAPVAALSPKAVATQSQINQIMTPAKSAVPKPVALPVKTPSLQEIRMNAAKEYAREGIKTPGVLPTTAPQGEGLLAGLKGLARRAGVFGRTFKKELLG